MDAEMLPTSRRLQGKQPQRPPPVIAVHGEESDDDLFGGVRLRPQNEDDAEPELSGFLDLQALGFPDDKVQPEPSAPSEETAEADQDPPPGPAAFDVRNVLRDSQGQARLMASPFGTLVCVSRGARATGTATVSINDDHLSFANATAMRHEMETRG